jgi:protein-L-isoaspartate(D-aspartate) O-methyltransferase
LVAAAPLSVPDALLSQLAVGGRLVMPVGAEGRQQLLRLTRTEEGVTRETLGAVSFVPLQSGTV